MKVINRTVWLLNWLWLTSVNWKVVVAIAKCASATFLMRLRSWVMESSWVYLTTSGERIGPCSEGELAVHYRHKRVGPETFVCREGTGQWNKIVELPELHVKLSSASRPDLTSFGPEEVRQSTTMNDSFALEKPHVSTLLRLSIVLTIIWIVLVATISLTRADYSIFPGAGLLPLSIIWGSWWVWQGFQQRQTQGGFTVTASVLRLSPILGFFATCVLISGSVFLWNERSDDPSLVSTSGQPDNLSRLKFGKNFADSRLDFGSTKDAEKELPQAGFSLGDYGIAADLTFCAFGMKYIIAPKLVAAGFVDPAKYANDSGNGAQIAAAIEIAMIATRDSNNPDESIKQQMGHLLERAIQFYEVQIEIGGNPDELTTKYCGKVNAYQADIIRIARNKGMFDPNVTTGEANQLRGWVSTAIEVWK